MLTTPVASNVGANQQYLSSTDPYQWDPNDVADDGANSQTTLQNANASAQLTEENYSSNSLSFTYTNKDGDTVSLNIQSVEYQKAVLDASADPNSAAWKKIVAFMQEQFQKMQASIVQTMTDQINGTDSKDADKTAQTDTNTTPAQDTSSQDAIPGLPAYWNAENTSQRIVDFATSFFGLQQGSNADFLKMIKDAIDEGFKEAGVDMKNMPDAVKNLVGDTQDLVNKKLDEWANAQGIDDTQTQDTAVQAAA